MTKQEVFQHNLPYIRKMLDLSCKDAARCIGIPREAVMQYELRKSIKDTTKQQLLYWSLSRVVSDATFGKKMNEQETRKFVGLFENLVDPNDPEWKEVRRGV